MLAAGEVVHGGGGGGGREQYKKPLYFLLRFAVDLKLLSRRQFTKKQKREREDK